MTQNDLFIKRDRMRYTKDSFSSGLVLLAIVFNVLYFVSIYQTDVGRYYYNWVIGASVVYNLLFLLNNQCMYFLTQEDSSILNHLHTPQLETDEFVLASYINVHITLILQWHSRGFDTPTVDMAKKFLRLMHEPLVKVVGHYTEYQTKDQQTGQTKYGHMFELDSIAFVTQDSKNLQQNQGGQQAAPQQQYQQPQQAYQPQQNYQPPQQNYQPQQNFQQQAPQSNFTMFDENQSPF